MKNLYLVYFCLTRAVYRLFFRIKPVGREKIVEGAAILCANHSSNQDVLCLAHAVGIRHFLRFVAKIELKRVPLLGRLLELAGTIYINRGKSDVTAVKNIMKALKNGDKVVIFPEGTRTAQSGAQAKAGVVMIASKTGVPVIPVYIPRKKKLFRTLTVVFGEPYLLKSVKGGAEYYETLATELMEKIEELGA